MSYRRLQLAPQSRVAADRRGAVLGRFCEICGSIYPRWARYHSGKPMYGKDHVAAPCTEEGEEFVKGASWWEPAVELLPEPEAAESDEAAAS